MVRSARLGIWDEVQHKTSTHGPTCALKTSTSSVILILVGIQLSLSLDALVHLIE